MADDVLAAIEDLELSQFKEELLKNLEGTVVSVPVHCSPSNSFPAYRKSQKAKKANKADVKKPSVLTPTTPTPTSSGAKREEEDV